MQTREHCSPGLAQSPRPQCPSRPALDDEDAAARPLGPKQDEPVAGGCGEGFFPQARSSLIASNDTGACSAKGDACNRIVFRSCRPWEGSGGPTHSGQIVLLWPKRRSRSIFTVSAGRDGHCGRGDCANPGEQCSRVCIFSQHGNKRDQPGVGTTPHPMAGSNCSLLENANVLELPRICCVDILDE